MLTISNNNNLKLINKIKMLLVFVSAGFVFFKLNINNKQHIRIAVNYDKQQMHELSPILYKVG